MENIGIIGQGFVGSAINEVFKESFNIETYDKYLEERTTNSLENIVQDCQNIFVCVPTPMNMQDGSASIHIVEEVVGEINQHAMDLGKRPTLIIKSTIPVGTTEMLGELAQYCNVVFSPEFLTEANAIEDFRNQTRVVIGVNHEIDENNPGEYVFNLRDIFKKGLSKASDIIITDSRTAELVKYTTNTFLSTKVSYANELYNIAQSCGVNYNDLITIAKLDKRLGDSHWMVPGPDGDFGFGGHCFPKDLEALRSIAKNNGVETKVLDAVKELNDDVRMDRDWERQEGRAVINNQGRTEKQVAKNYKVLAYLIKISALLAAASITLYSIKSLI